MAYIVLGSAVKRSAIGRLGPVWMLEGDFGRFWIGQTISSLGDAFTGFALPLLIYQVTGTALSLAISSAAAFLPYLLFGLVIGAWVDRVDRRRLMLLTDLARALLIASIPLLLAAGFFALWYIYVVQFIVATLAVGFNSAQPAALASLVERDQLRAANGRIIAGHSAGWIVGPLLAGGLATVVSLPALLLIDALSYLVSALALALIRTSFNRNTTPPTGLLADIAAALRYVWTQPVIRAITLLLVLLNAVGPTARVQIVLFAKQRLQASDGQVALLSAAAAAGVLLASLGAGRARCWPASRMSIGALLAQGLLLIAFAQTHHFWAALALWALLAGLSVIVDISIMSLRQLIAPDRMLGRITAITRTVGFAAIPLNALIGGMLIDQLGDVAAIYS
ncbi:MAG TPA: MFS transporter, partial [Roseiflexaceae bacterium]|nr:MFS transporter [Roseiflexaceae bacterium]